VTAAADACNAKPALLLRSVGERKLAKALSRSFSFAAFAAPT
jgi:hypothetical protein